MPEQPLDPGDLHLTGVWVARAGEGAEGQVVDSDRSWTLAGQGLWLFLFARTQESHS